MPKKIAAFDIFGTSFGFDNVIQAIDEEFGAELKQAGTTSAHLFMSWFYATQRDFTYLTVCDQYTPMAKVFAATLPRALAIGLNPAPKYPSVSHAASFPEDKLKRILAELRKLPARPGLIDCFETLWNDGFEIYAVSNGATESTKGLLQPVQSKLKHDVFASGEFDKYIISCDEVKRAKPTSDIYTLTLEKAGADPSKGDTCWFVAAHTWDLLAARKAGFKTAYVTYEELVSCEEIYGTPDVTEDGLAKAAKSIVGRI